MSTSLKRVFQRRDIRRLGSKTAHAPSWFEVRREHHPAVGLARELLRDADQVSRVDRWAKPLLKDKAILAAIARDDAPIPATEDREGYFDDRHLAYWLSGAADLKLVDEMVPAAAMTSVLDFGGASGRFARHVPLVHEAATVTVADINVNHVEWVNQRFGRAVRAVKVSPYPQFPIADASIALCVGLSVFTHIDSYETGWLAEMHRVLRQGGYAFVTVHSEHTWPLLKDHPEVMRTLQKIPDFINCYQPGSPMPAERLAFISNPKSIEHNCNTFFHSNYIRHCWGKWFEVLDIRPQAHHNFQSVVLLRKLT
jgi:ubiquinone/menaquinone biosynthesis C-methylase UbiE